MSVSLYVCYRVGLRVDRYLCRLVCPSMTVSLKKNRSVWFCLVGFVPVCFCSVRFRYVRLTWVRFCCSGLKESEGLTPPLPCNTIRMGCVGRVVVMYKGRLLHNYYIIYMIYHVGCSCMFLVLSRFATSSPLDFSEGLDCNKN